MPLTNHIIIAGTGCAGLSLAMHMAASGKFGDYEITLVDKEKKQLNDRTWCFWEAGQGLFEPVVKHRWNHAWFHGKGFSGKLSLSPYQYKMIRGIDFYDYCYETLGRYPNFHFCYEKAEAVFSEEASAGVRTSKGQLEGDLVFSSILFNKPAGNHHYWMLQHFKGWIIETEDPVFDVEAATIMDFRIQQQDDTRFCYVLPLSQRRALVEYTVFSNDLLSEAAYQQGLKDYIETVLKIRNYKITEVESGVIPMTNYAFAPRQGNVWFIGTAGGQTKGSSGYTFRFIQKQSASIVNAMLQYGNPVEQPAAARFHFYDSVLLNILHHKRLPGQKIFTTLFRKNPPAKVLRFLDNETSLRQDLGIISSLPILPFSRAALSHLFH